jgi:hypothetical protein
LELLNQFDLSNPDHLTVITKDDKLTISVLKDGVSLTLGYPLNTKEPFNTTSPDTPSLPSSSVRTVVRKERQERKPSNSRHSRGGAYGTTHIRYRGRIPKLNEAQVIEIKMMLADKPRHTKRLAVPITSQPALSRTLLVASAGST